MFWTHIICGQITGTGQAQGLHTETPTSNWPSCVSGGSCSYYSDGNGECSNFYIYDATTQTNVPKSFSTLFSLDISAKNLVGYLQNIANQCGQTTSFCATGCTYANYQIPFSIYFHMVDRGILSAYPVYGGCPTSNTCANPSSCQNM